MTVVCRGIKLDFIHTASQEEQAEWDTRHALADRLNRRQAPTHTHPQLLRLLVHSEEIE